MLSILKKSESVSDGSAVITRPDVVCSLTLVDAGVTDGANVVAPAALDACGARDAVATITPTSAIRTSVCRRFVVIASASSF